MYISQYKRLPFGSYLGEYKNASNLDLLSFLIEKIFDNSSITPQGFALGCALQAANIQSFAKNALLKSKTYMNIPCVVLNKSMGSGFSALLYGMHSMQINSKKAYLCAVVDNVSCSPYLLNINHTSHFNNLILKNYLMENFFSINSQILLKNIDAFSEQNGISSQHKDEYLLRSRKNYMDNQNIIEKEIEPYKNDFCSDEIDWNNTSEDQLKFSDGASVFMIKKEKNSSDDIEILAIEEYSGHPFTFCQSAILAIAKLLKRLNLTHDDVDFFEIDESFPVVPIAFMQCFEIGRDRVNVLGGSSVVGHSFSVISFYLIMNLISALKENGGGIGVAALSMPGGEGCAIAIKIE